MELKSLSNKNLVGIHIEMSLKDNKTYQLWREFMCKCHIISNRIGQEFYSIEVYKPLYFENYNPDSTFEKWAAVAVTNSGIIPDGMDTIILDGTYAVFVHKGPASKGGETYQYIFNTWLPTSGFQLDNRPHFAIMGEKYKNEEPDSEEELWIPIKSRT